MRIGTLLIVVGFAFGLGEMFGGYLVQDAKADKRTMIDIASARIELDTRTKADIEASTADTWAARAIAAYQIAIERKSIARLIEGSDYEHEAIEHAAQVSPQKVREIESAINSYLEEAKRVFAL